MTEIGDERQRLVGDTWNEAARIIEAQEGMAGWKRRIATHFRAKAHDPADQSREDAARAALASRPQEQPRTATGEWFPGDGESEPLGHDFIEGCLRALGHDPHPPSSATSIQASLADAGLEIVRRLSVSPAAAQGWQTMETAPKDGTPITGQELYRYLPYKPEGRKQMHADGRWQRHNGYGWENASPPTHWMPLGDDAAAPPSPAAQEQKP